MANSKTSKGADMFSMEQMPEGKMLLNEYTEDGIIKHEFQSMTELEIWIMKYRGYHFN